MENESGSIYRKVFGQALFQYLAAFIATLNLLCCGMHYGWASPSLPKLQSNESDFTLTTSETSWIATAIMCGVVLGAVSALVLSNIMGRKMLILLTTFPCLVSWMVMAFATSFTTLIVGRVIAGVADGWAFCSVPLYIAEISEPKIRGFLGTSASVVWLVGILLMNALGSYLSIKNAALIASTSPLIVLLIFPWMPESPYYLLMKNKPEQAQKCLQTLRGTKNIETEISRLIASVQIQNKSLLSKCVDLITVPCNRKAFFTILGLRGLQQLCGITAIMFYAQVIFENGKGYISASTSSIIFFALYFVFSGLCSLLVDRTGRKPLLIISVIGAGVALFLEGCYFYFKNTTVDTTDYSLISTIIFFVYIVLYSIGMQAIPTLLFGELLPTIVKSIAVCFCQILFAIVATILLQGYQYLNENCGVHVPFFIFSGFCVVCLIFIICCVPETKGKTLEEIQEGFVGTLTTNKSRQNEKFNQRANTIV